MAADGEALPDHCGGVEAEPVKLKGEMMSELACETPLIDLLLGVPADARMIYEESPTSSHSIPVGRLCVDAAAEIDRLRTEMMEWRPIETAPRDGTRVLIYAPEASRQKVQEAYWATPWDGAADEQCWWSTPHGPAGRGYTILTVAVTHWMPLPSPPETTSAKT